MKHWRTSLFFLALCGVIPSCGKKQIGSRVTSRNKSDNAALSQTQITVQEAKFSDIPSPLTAVPLPPYYQAEQGNALFAYKVSLSSDEVMAFYVNEMERLGWRMAFNFSGYESMLQFEKPDYLCIVSIRPGPRGSHTEWVIATGPSIEIS